MTVEPSWGQRHYNDLSPDTDMTISHLKRIAKWLKRAEGIQHWEALDRIAQRMGYVGWDQLYRETRDAATDKG